MAKNLQELKIVVTSFYILIIGIMEQIANRKSQIANRKSQIANNKQFTIIF
jgi:hypothetical protein